MSAAHDALHHLDELNRLSSATLCRLVLPHADGWRCGLLSDSLRELVALARLALIAREDSELAREIFPKRSTDQC